MAEMEAQIKFSTNADFVAKDVAKIPKAFKELKSSTEDVSKSLDDSTGAAEATAAALDDTATQADKVADTSDGIANLARELDTLEKAAKKLGRDFSTLVTAPIAALAGLSLKNLYDTGSLEKSTGAARNFAIAIQNLQKNFKILLDDLGARLAPIGLQVVGILNTLIDKFQGLSKETKGLVINVGLIAAAIGPALLAFSSIASIFVKLTPVIITFSNALFNITKILISPVALVAALGVSLIGLANVFAKLRKAGVSTSEALLSSFTLFVTGFNNYIVKNLLKGLQKIAQAIDFLDGDLNLSGMGAIALQIEKITNQMTQQFADAKKDIDSTLSSIGTSAGEAFTFGLSTELSKLSDFISNTFRSATSNVDLSGINKAEREAMLKDDYEYYQKLSQLMAEQAQRIQSTTEGIRTNISGGLADSFMDISTGAKTAEQAIGDFARQTIANFTKMILEAQIFNALMGFSGFRNATSRIGAAATTAPGMATGGYVSGPGSGTSDSILRRLSNGEFVSDAKTVKHFGASFFSNLKAMARGGVPVSPRGSVPGLADGGTVTSSAGAPQVMIQNKGSDKQVTGTSFDPASAVLTVFMDDISKNGPMSKTLQNTYGMKRATS